MSKTWKLQADWLLNDKHSSNSIHLCYTTIHIDVCMSKQDNDVVSIKFTAVDPRKPDDPNQTVKYAVLDLYVSVLMYMC